MSEVKRWFATYHPLGNLAGPEGATMVLASDYDALKATLVSRDEEIQCLRGANARKSIVLSIVDDILEDAEYDATSLDAEYWGDLHDKAVALQRAHTALKAENERLAAALDEARAELARAIACMPSDSPADVKSARQALHSIADSSSAAQGGDRE